MREPPTLTSDEWWLMLRSVKFARDRRAFVVHAPTVARLVEAKLVRIYALPWTFQIRGAQLDPTIMIPTPRGEREVARWKKRVIPDVWGVG